MKKLNVTSHSFTLAGSSLNLTLYFNPVFSKQAQINSDVPKTIIKT